LIGGDCEPRDAEEKAFCLASSLKGVSRLHRAVGSGSSPNGVDGLFAGMNLGERLTGLHDEDRLCFCTIGTETVDMGS
jgi:hypothetical protein